jgi:leader peptidase (prepilin peptidase)/N-methyltransferase
MLILVILSGIVVGGLVNMLADSLPYHRRPHAPMCLACTAPRPWKAWLGISSLLSKTWRCRYCNTPRSLRTILVEAWMIVGTLWLYREGQFSIVFWVELFILSLFTLIVVIDIEHHLILHVVTGPSALVLILVGSLDSDQGVQATLLGGVAGFGVVFVFYLLGIAFAQLVARLRGEDTEEVAFGFGDVTLATVLGFIVGFPAIFVALFLGVLAAGEFSLIYILFSLVRKRYQAFMPIPYGPFLIFGTMIVHFGGKEIVEAVFPYGPLWFLVVVSLVFVLQSIYLRFRSG